MNIQRIKKALSIIDAESWVCELAIIGWRKADDTPLKHAKRQLKAKAMGIVKHDRMLKWRS